MIVRIALTAALLCGPSGSGILASQQPSTDVGVELGVEIAARGEQVRLPVILSGKAKQVTSAMVRVTYPGKKLVFDKAEAAAQDTKKPDDPDISAETVPGSTDSSTIELRVKGKPGTTLRDGVVALLLFKVAADAEPGDVTVSGSARVGIGADEPVAAQAKNGLVTILGTPPTVVACFFYMH